MPLTALLPTSERISRRYGRARAKEASVSYPVVLHTAIDARDCRGLAEFYRELLGLHYRHGDEAPTDGQPDDAD